MINYEKILAEKEQEILDLKAENAALKEKAILFPGKEEAVLNLKDIIAMFPGNIFWRDANGKLLGVNNNLARFCGFDNLQQLAGQDVDSLMPAVSESLSIVDRTVLETGEEFIGTEIGLDHENNTHYFISHKTPVFSPTGKVSGLLGISLNITEQKKLEMDLQIEKEKAEASSRAKSQFLAVINHELRTPIASIINLLTFLKREESSEGTSETIRSLENCSQYLLNLVTNVLDYSKLETSKPNLHIQLIDLKTLFEEVFSMLNPLAMNKNLTLRLACSPSMPSFIWSDSQILQQILINLINNAIKFTESGTIVLRVACFEREDQHATLEFSVIDTGSGMPSDKLDVIFEPFKQLEDPYKRQSSRSGTGLGLAIVKRLAQSLDMKISVTSTVGVGSTFTLLGKFKIQGDYAQEDLKLEKSAVTKDWNITPYVLLIEDDPIIQFVHSKMLSELGCQVDIAKNGSEALSLLRGHDIVFVDISLPDMNGFEVIKSIRARTDKDCRVPIVALTAYTEKEERNACLEAGANYFTNKPVSTNQLQEIISQHLGIYE